jgi:hypothetical protein
MKTTKTQTAAARSRTPRPIYTEEQYQADLETCSTSNAAPQDLRLAALQLVSLAAGTTENSPVHDSFGEDVSAAVSAMRAALRVCRAALDAIEEEAREVLKGDAEYAAQRCAEFQAVGTF